MKKIEKKYVIKKFNTEENLKLLKLKKEYKKIPELVLKHIIINNIENIDEYLFPTIDKMDIPFNMKNLKESAELILKKIQSEPNKILIVGDYDTDGITSSSILYLYFKEMFNIEIDVYIPERIEGYGLKKEIIDYAIENKKDFIITVDNGIAAFEAVDYANEKNITVIITDHHPLINDKIPNTKYVINAQQKDCNYKDKYICGAGVAFNLIRGMNIILKNRNTSFYEDLMPILAIGTVADVVPLINDNRIFVKNGINKEIKNKGLKKLLERLEIEKMSSTDIAFKIAPLLNSTGREGYARLGFRLFTEENDEIIDFIIEQLIDFNIKRKEEQKFIFNDLLKNIEESKLDAKHYGFLLYPKNEEINYNPAIVGIVASKIVEKYLKPTIIVSYEENEFFIDNEGTVFNKSDRLKIIFENEIINLGETIILNDLFVKNKRYIKSMINNEKKQRFTIEKIKEDFNILEEKKLKNGYIKLKVKSKFLKGSGRSPEWFDFRILLDKLREENLLLSGGGHKLAAGFTFKETDLEKVQKIFDDIAKEMVHPVVKEILEIIELPDEKQLTKDILSIIHKSIEIIEPIGEKNKQPLILYDIGEHSNLKFLGETKEHISLKTESGIRMIGFNLTRNKKLPNLSNKLFLAELYKKSFINKENKKITYFEFNIIDLIPIDKLEL